MCFHSQKDVSTLSLEPMGDDFEGSCSAVNSWEKERFDCPSYVKHVYIAGFLLCGGVLMGGVIKIMYDIIQVGI